MGKAWKKEYNVGVELVDNQHQEMFKIMNELDDAISAKRPKEELNMIINSLIDWSKNHFKFEEDIFKKLKFEHKEEHEKHHSDFKKKLEDLRNKIKQKHDDIQEHLAKYLRDWLTDHIHQDRKFVELFNKNGIT